jgi:copper chaperone CopZ
VKYDMPRLSRCLRFVMTGLLILLTTAVAAGSLAAQQDGNAEELPAVESSDSVDRQLTRLVNELRKDYQATGEFSEQARQALRESLEKQYDSLVANFKRKKSPETNLAVFDRFELLSETRDKFIEARLDVAVSDVTGSAVDSMTYRAFVDVCAELGIRVNLSGKIIQGAPVAGSRIVTLRLPKMDCPGCASIVRTELGKLEGVLDSRTSVEQGSCRVEVTADLKLDEKLDELAKTVVQFQEWSR